jgi:4-amino-4-deoxy-L-arabinose transferase-like glycosyltransferase
LLAFGTFLAVVLTLDGPGITVDEPLDVRPGRTYLSTLRAKGPHFFDRRVVDRVFRDNAEHPPLGRWLLGLASVIGEPFEVLLRGPDPLGLYVRSGRLAPAAAFALLVGVVATTTARRYERAAGLASGLALALMPRAFAHAHIAALDTFTACFWTLALLHADQALGTRRPILAMSWAGVSWALALLTKIHAWLLPPLVFLWALKRLPWRRGVPAFVAWIAVGIVLYVLGWPWLWYDPVGRLRAYLGTGVVRTTIYTQYFHTVYADRDVPWHYPWFYFAVTVPVGLHALGVLGLFRAWRRRTTDSLPVLLLGAMVLLLLVFSTRVPVYDGERLFLPVFPLWAMFIGMGFGWAWSALTANRLARTGLRVFLVGQAYGLLAVHPFGLSYYNLLAGGLSGAVRMGLELTFWGDTVDDRLLEELTRQAQPGQSAALAPTLAPNQGLYSTTARMAGRKPPLLLQDEAAAATADWVVVSRRTAYWKPEVAALVRQPPVYVRTRQGVWLSGLWRRHPPESFKSD